jgi:aminomethyltransferase
MLKRTPLFELHCNGGAKMVDFGGWEMPLHYGSQLQEHIAVRAGCGMFDVSHMRVVDISGDDSLAFLRMLLANDAARLAPGKALYTCMLRPDGGVLDDLILYRLGEDANGFRAVVNAATADKDLAWMEQVREAQGFQVAVRAPADMALIAVQGPKARAQLARAVPELGATLDSIGVFSASTVGDFFVARTGYTGEDGCEIALPARRAAAFWNALHAAGVTACGLGARDTLRLEAGLNLYGSDMDESVSPLESGLGWTVDLRTGREFIGRVALERQQHAANLRQLVGLKFAGRGVPRSHQVVRTSQGEGSITSGTYGPTVACSIALARVPAGIAPGDELEVELRTGVAKAQVCRPPFVRHGKVLV